MKIYFDTEFTNLNTDAKLISIGLIDETGNITFYEEVDGYRIEECSTYCHEKVLPHLHGDNIRAEDLRVKLTKWLLQFPSVVLVCDNQKDIAHMNEILGGSLPANCQYRKLNFLDGLKRKMTNKKVHLKNNLRFHHALDDAKANRLIFEP